MRGTKRIFLASPGLPYYPINRARSEEGQSNRVNKKFWILHCLVYTIPSLVKIPFSDFLFLLKYCSIRLCLSKRSRPMPVLHFITVYNAQSFPCFTMFSYFSQINCFFLFTLVFPTRFRLSRNTCQSPENFVYIVINGIINATDLSSKLLLTVPHYYSNKIIQLLTLNTVLLTRPLPGSRLSYTTW